VIETKDLPLGGFVHRCSVVRIWHAHYDQGGAKPVRLCPEGNACRKGAGRGQSLQPISRRAEHIAGSSCSGCDHHGHRTEIRPFLARDFDVIVNGLPRLLRQLKPDGPAGLLLPHCGAIDRKPAGLQRPRPEVRRHRSPAACCRSRQGEHCQVARPSICNRVRIDQTCFGRSGGFWPMSFPLFQGSGGGVEDIVCASVSMVILLGG
jgi:hypothetical protein